MALESPLASDADEALVTLTYLPGGDRPARVDLPGGDRPARVDLLIDRTPWDRIVVPAGFGALESRMLHGLFAPASAHAVNLACWGHQQSGMPWELPSPESESTGSGATGTIEMVMQKSRSSQINRVHE